MQQIMTPCPKCGETRLYRSHARNGVEQLIRRFLPLKLYRCHDCQWRGWISKRKLKAMPGLAQSVGFYLLVVLIALFVGIMMKQFIQ